jgi:hypothetical protein
LATGILLSQYRLSGIPRKGGLLVR